MIEESPLAFYTLASWLAETSSRSIELKENRHSLRQSIGVGIGPPELGGEKGLPSSSGNSTPMLFKMTNEIDPLHEMEADATVAVWQRE